MSTTIQWAGGAGTPIIQPAASGGLNTCGFFGSAFGFSIRVGEFNNTTYRTTADGTTDGGALPNLRWANSSGAYVASELVATELLEVANAEATLNVLLTTDNAVKTQNASLRAFDRVAINNNPSGVTIYAAEIAKDSAVRGSGDVSWTIIAGSGSVLSLADQTTDDFTEHNYYIGLSATPTSIGSKTNLAFYWECEFL
ncbi:MAG: hypothetical protein KKH44_08915 [Bacteroidetes bacterium]|nr:hypothetical protein [Bacteroidota bacterium]